MKKAKLERYDLDRVYYLKEYQRAVAHAEKNISISGVKDQLDSLKAEKSRYSAEVSSLIEAKRSNEQKKYGAYEKWENRTRLSSLVFICGVIGVILMMFFSQIFRGFVGTLVSFLVLFAFLVGGLTAIISVLGKTWSSKQYQKYVSGIARQFDSI